MYCEIFIWKVNVLPTSTHKFWRIKSIWVKNKISIYHLINISIFNFEEIKYFWKEILMDLRL